MNLLALVFSQGKEPQDEKDNDNENEEQDEDNDYDYVGYTMKANKLIPLLSFGEVLILAHFSRFLSALFISLSHLLRAC